MPLTILSGMPGYRRLSEIPAPRFWNGASAGHSSTEGEFRLFEQRDEAKIPYCSIFVHCW